MTLAWIVPQRPTDGKTEDGDSRIGLLRQIRGRLESQMRPDFDPALSLLLDEIVQIEESFEGEGQP